jgi:selenide, water dikinase
VPVLGAARGYVAAGMAPGGTHSNRRFLAEWVDYDPDITEDEQLLLCDAQTSGGLLAAVAGDQAPALVRELREMGAAATSLIGSIEAGRAGRIRVLRTPQSGDDPVGQG